MTTLSTASSSSPPHASFARAILAPLRLCLLLVVVLCIVEGRDAFQPPLGRTPTSPNTALFVGKPSKLTDEERAIALEKATKAMTSFTNKYLQNTCTKLCVDKSVPAVVIKGLAEHKVDLGAPLCPCRFYDDKEQEAKDGYWNCPCVPMRERHECHCMLFLTDDNDFAGSETDITYEEVLQMAAGMEL